MPALYTLPNGESRTTCGDHRRAGYAMTLSGSPRYVCRSCGLAEDLHETAAETIARNAVQA